MQKNITSGWDYDSLIYNNPITLLQVIKEHSLNYQENRYEMAIILDAFRSTFTSRQKGREILQDCTRKFKMSIDTLEYHLGDL